jgi:hypothetical protein
MTSKEFMVEYRCLHCGTSKVIPTTEPAYPNRMPFNKEHFVFTQGHGHSLCGTFVEYRIWEPYKSMQDRVEETVKGEEANNERTTKS